MWSGRGTMPRGRGSQSPAVHPRGAALGAGRPRKQSPQPRTAAARAAPELPEPLPAATAPPAAATPGTPEGAMDAAPGISPVSASSWLSSPGPCAASAAASGRVSAPPVPLLALTHSPPLGPGVEPFSSPLATGGAARGAGAPARRLEPSPEPGRGASSPLRARLSSGTRCSDAAKKRPVSISPGRTSVASAQLRQLQYWDGSADAALVSIDINTGANATPPSAARRRKEAWKKKAEQRQLSPPRQDLLDLASAPTEGPAEGEAADPQQECTSQESDAACAADPEKEPSASAQRAFQAPPAQRRQLTPAGAKRSPAAAQGKQAQRRFAVPPGGEVGVGQPNYVRSSATGWSCPSRSSFTSPSPQPAARKALEPHQQPAQALAEAPKPFSAPPRPMGPLRKVANTDFRVIPAPEQSQSAVAAACIAICDFFKGLRAFEVQDSPVVNCAPAAQRRMRSRSPSISASSRVPNLSMRSTRSRSASCCSRSDRSARTDNSSFLAPLGSLTRSEEIARFRQRHVRRRSSLFQIIVHDAAAAAAVALLAAAAPPPASHPAEVRRSPAAARRGRRGD
eukprot:TRINITY_DN46766_c0_g1_i1.p1 TRINITY_DN46766_c0_g1~~TRINITY_DN46766_c0_g1_i1.p1  ORF type:complete len:599 (+),score=134.80 TRINITY_DN46766_c0_g1_i1:91-1797(+)